MEWNEVKAKPKRKTKPKTNTQDQGFHGASSGNYGAPSYDEPVVNKNKGAAQAIADYDPLAGAGSDEEQKLEVVSHECAVAVANARHAKQWSQAQLAKAVNEKTGMIVDIENGSAPYNADLINRIERALGVQIPRGRKKNKKKKK